MIKRMTKTTALLIAAASTISMVPANAATKLAVKEGTIENAIAFEGGNYIFEGYKTDDDDNGVYFNNGSEDKLLEDVEKYDSLIKYGSKYALATDGDDQYMIDLSTGKVSDEDTAEDLRSTVENKLNSLLRKTDRYEDAKDKKPVISVDRLSKGQFSDVWYEYTATTGEAVVYGYTNQSGKYIDAGVTANLYVKDTAANKMVKIEEFGDTEGNVTATLTEDVKPLTIGADSKYVYRIISVDVKEDGQDAEKTAFYLQKISKEQGDKKKGAYLPKTVESYLISDIEKDNAGFLNSDAAKAGKLLEVDVDGDKVVINSNLQVGVLDGVVYTLEHSDNEVTVTKLTLKRNEKVESGSKKLDYSLVKKTGDVDTDAYDVSVDIEGNVWAIYKGEISRSVKGGDFEVVYTCDRSLDNLDVYNEGNLVAWDSEGEVYTTVQEGKDASKEEAEDVVGGTDTVIKTGWDQNADGTWVLYDVAGNKLTGWQLVNGTWYYMDPTTAIMKTGWLNDNGTWYYLQSSGAMKTGWLLDGSTWYYLQANGAMKTGWLKDTDGRWYYLNANGSMAANTVVDGYKLGANGAWIR